LDGLAENGYLVEFMGKAFSPLRVDLGVNFYCSCERVFHPKLNGRPLIVLSNNDGCAVSRSNEAKALGIKMGQPLFKIPGEIKRQGLIALSSNYALYADLSNRMMRIMGEVTPHQEIYSIDESFIDLSHCSLERALTTARELRARIIRSIGIPTCVGIGATKTLAKLANHVAKKGLVPDLAGVFAWESLGDTDSEAVMDMIEIGEVWGVGRRLTEQLQVMGIRSALDLKRADRATITKRFSVVLARTVDELNGKVCLALDEVTPGKQQIMTSRSFGHTVTEQEQLAAAIAKFASRGAEKLRQQGSLANAVQVFAMTNRFAVDEPQYTPSLLVPLSIATDNSMRITQAALYGLKSFYRPGFQYKKAGVMLTGLEQHSARQLDLFSSFDESRSSRLMAAMDAVNSRYGQDTLRLAITSGQGAAASAMRRERKSPGFTTRWNEIPVAVC
jgi:DNA polymerase V